MQLPRCAVVFLLLAGCGADADRKASLRDPILDAPPVPAEVVDRVLNPRQEDVASPDAIVLDDLGERLGAVLEQAAAQEPVPTPADQGVRVILFTADWCMWCRPAKERAVPWLKSQGYVVEIADVTRGPLRGTTFRPRSLPAWLFVKDGREAHRQEGGYLPEHLQEAVKRVPATAPPAVGGWLGPTFRVADALPFVAGTTMKLGTAATISIPRELKWSVSQKAGSVTLSFDPAPQVTVHKVLNWKVRLEGIEITPVAVTLQIDNLPDITVKFDWSFPERRPDAVRSDGEDMHRASMQKRRVDRPVLTFLGRTVLLAYRVCSIASLVLIFA